MQYRAAQKSGWTEDQKLFEEVANTMIKLANAYLHEGSANSLYSAKTKIRAILKKTEVWN